MINDSAEIRVEQLYKAFGSKSVLRGVDLDVRHGQMVAVIGGSGSGKTTLLKLLTAQLRPDQGRVLVADHESPGAPLVDLANCDEMHLDRFRRHWAIVFQGNALFSGTVFDNIALALDDVKHMDPPSVRASVEQAIKSVELDVDSVTQLNVDELSGGMAKRVAIARAIALDPMLIFYDEPTTGLDPQLTVEIQDLVLAMHLRKTQSGAARTSVIITHDRDLLYRLQPRIVMLHGGLISFDGTYDAFARSDSPIIRPYYEFMPALQQAGQ